MNKKKIVLLSGLFLISLSLTSCFKGVTSQTNENITYCDIDFATQYLSYVPNSGNPNILVILVEFSDRNSFSSTDLNNLEITFNGESRLNNKTSYWESVKSFYSTSSYGKLNLNFTVCDAFTPSISSYQFLALENNSSSGAISILNEFYDKGTIDGEKINYQDFDSDKDGFIDGVWIIYKTENYNEVYQNQHFWAYTSWIINEPNVDKPVFNTFANCSSLFLNEGKNSNGVDSHTLIHETGHMLGLDDYYTYDNDIYSSSGGLMMMDLNIGDHDAFSKYALGWIEPNVITSKGTYTLKPFESSGEALLIPSDSYYNNAFGEYLIIEYYTPTLLNELDSRVTYDYEKLYDESGVLIYHIDARLIDVDIINDVMGTGRFDFIDLNDYSFKASTSDNFVEVGSSNTDSYSNTDFNLISLIPKNNRLLKRYRYSDNNSLFLEADSFNMNTYSKFFNLGRFNDYSTMNYNIEIEVLNEESVTIRIS